MSEMLEELGALKADLQWMLIRAREVVGNRHPPLIAVLKSAIHYVEELEEEEEKNAIQK